MSKTILLATKIPQTYHPALGPLFDVTFTDGSTAQIYAETFFDQIPEWRPDQPLEGHSINLEIAYTA